MTKTILLEIQGWTPLIDAVAAETSVLTAAVFGVVWRYCQMPDGACSASAQQIAAKLRISTKSVYRHLQRLEQLGYIERTGYATIAGAIEYRETGQAGLKASLAATEASPRLKKLSTGYHQGQKVLPPGTESPTP